MCLLFWSREVFLRSRIYFQFQSTAAMHITCHDNGDVISRFKHVRTVSRFKTCLSIMSSLTSKVPVLPYMVNASVGPATLLSSYLHRLDEHTMARGFLLMPARHRHSTLLLLKHAHKCGIKVAACPFLCLYLCVYLCLSLSLCACVSLCTCLCRFQFMFAFAIFLFAVRS